MVISKGEIFTLHMGSKLGNVSFLAVPLDDLGFKIFWVLCFIDGIVLESPAYVRL